MLDDNLQHIESPGHKTKAYYLLLVVLILEENIKIFDATFEKLDEYLQKHKSEILDNIIDTSLFDVEVFAVQDQDKRTQFEKLKVRIKAR